MTDHLTLAKVDLFLVAISTCKSIDERKEAIFDLLGGYLPSDVRPILHEILEEIDPISCIQERKVA
ncbi:hypothetical protein U2P60_14765 [Brucella sp. H1_1004]|uniref:hypothetical protein n=1 Tax=Brucella sp. H1_1004 TaxID=3110109 RepID=UPI0039B387E4